MKQWVFKMIFCRPLTTLEHVYIIILMLDHVHYLCYDQTPNAYFPLRFVKNRIRTIRNNSVLGHGWVLGSKQMF